MSATRMVSTLAFTLAALAAGAAHAAAPLKTQNGMLVDGAGMTVYTFDKDTAGSGKSVCNDGCAKAWPPVMAKDGDKPDGDYSIVTRDDGSKQWAHKGKPLYLFQKDTKPGEVNGDNFKEIWHVVKP